MRQQIEVAQRKLHEGPRSELVYEVLFRFMPGGHADSMGDLHALRQVTDIARALNPSVRLPASMARMLGEAPIEALNAAPIRLKDENTIRMQQALDAHNGNVNHAAKSLGMHPRTMYRYVVKGRLLKTGRLD